MLPTSRIPCVARSLNKRDMVSWRPSRKKVIKKILLMKENIPGVGQYKLPSEFGVYEAAPKS